MTLDLSAYKPVSDTVTDAAAISSAFTALETWGNALPTTSVPSGVISQYGGTSAPSGWFVCDGSAISRTTYSALFTAFGTDYGVGDGSSTFNLPDFRGRVAVGYAASGGHADVSTLGNNDGVTLSHRRSKHRHTVTDPGHTHTAATPASGAGSGGAGATSGTTGSSTTGVTVGADTTNDALDTPAYLVVNWIVKT